MVYVVYLFIKQPDWWKHEACWAFQAALNCVERKGKEAVILQK